jgi:ketosteroid isomerase-like protein
MIGRLGHERKWPPIAITTGRTYRQDYVVFLRAAGGKIASLREYFDPTRAAKAMNAPILDRDS